MSTLDPDQTNAFGYFLADKNLIKWFFKTRGATFNDVCVVYDVAKDKFVIDGQKYFFDGVHFKAANYTVSMIEAKVYRDEYSQDDEGSPIPREYRTKYFYISDATYKKILWETRTLLDVNDLAVVTQDILIDGGIKNTKTLVGANIVPTTNGIGTASIGTFAIGEDGDDDISVADSDYYETYILVTKGNLNVK